MSNRIIEMHGAPTATVRNEGIKLPGNSKLTPSMLLAAIVDTAKAKIHFAIDKTGLTAGEKATYGPIQFRTAGQRVQYFATPSKRFVVIAGLHGLIAALGTLVVGTVEALVRVLGQLAGTPTDMFFTRVGGNFIYETLIVELDSGRVINLLAEGFTQVVYVPKLNGFTGLRATDEVVDNQRRFYYLSLADAEASRWATTNWKTSTTLSAAIRMIPWRITEATLSAVRVEVDGPNGAVAYEYVDLREIAQGRVTSLAEQAQSKAPIAALGTTIDGNQVVLDDTRTGETSFIPAPNFRAAVEQVQASA